MEIEDNIEEENIEGEERPNKVYKISENSNVIEEIAEKNLVEKNIDNNNNFNTIKEPKIKKKRKDRKPAGGYHHLRAHANPLSDALFSYPVSPDAVDWEKYFPRYFEKNIEAKPLVRFADVGCGFGGLLVALGPMFPDKLMVGLEIRKKVVEFVQQRYLDLQANSATHFNVACLRCNAMKHLPNYFKKRSIREIVFSLC